MLKLNGKEIKTKRFTDVTLNQKVTWNPIGRNTITWVYEDDRELFQLYTVTRHLQEHGVYDIVIVLPYIPNARMDRVKHDNEVFTMKYFAEIINSLHFSRVKVFDPHSAVSEALLNRIEIIPVAEYIKRAISEIGNENLVMFYPDEGAVKRYSELTSTPFVYGMKNRDWETREIRGLQIVDPAHLVKGHNVLMVDDICSSGKTLYYAAEKLKALGAGDIYLYVSHFENLHDDNPILHEKLVKRVFTTTSFTKIRHEKVHFLHAEWD